jgi:hypothetical protein
MSRTSKPGSFDSERGYYADSNGSILTLIQVMDEITLVVELDKPANEAVNFLGGNVHDLATRMRLTRLNCDDFCGFSFEVSDILLRFTIGNYVSALRTRKPVIKKAWDYASFDTRPEFGNPSGNALLDVFCKIIEKQDVIERRI